MQQKLDLRCERDGCTGTTVDSRLRLSSLPRVLVVHLKRFKLAPLHSTGHRVSRSNVAAQYGYLKDASRVVVPPVIDLREAGLCADACAPPPSTSLSSCSNEGAVLGQGSDLGVAATGGSRSRYCALGPSHPALEPLLKRLPPMDERQQHQLAKTSLFGTDKDLELVLAESLKTGCAAPREQLDLEQAVAASVAGAKEEGSGFGANRTARYTGPPPSAAYRLQSVICHHGKRAVRGHYTADVRSRDGRWRRCDDSSVTFVDEATVLREAQVQGYILFYTQLQE